MAGKKLSAKSQKALEALQAVRRKVDRVHNLIEQYCTARAGQDSMAQQIARAGADAGRLLMNNGMGVMADTANQIGMTARRGGHTPSKNRQLREALGTLKAAIERHEKNVLDADAMEKREAAEESGH